MAASYSRCIFQMFENQRWKWRPSSLNQNLRKTKMKILNMIWILHSSLGPLLWPRKEALCLDRDPGSHNHLWTWGVESTSRRRWEWTLSPQSKAHPQTWNVLSDSLIVAVNAFRCSLLSEDLNSLTQPWHWEICLSITTLVNMFLEDFIHGGFGS